MFVAQSTKEHYHFWVHAIFSYHRLTQPQYYFIYILINMMAVNQSQTSYQPSSDGPCNIQPTSHTLIKNACMTMFQNRFLALNINLHHLQAYLSFIVFKHICRIGLLSLFFNSDNSLGFQVSLKASFMALVQSGIFTIQFRTFLKQFQIIKTQWRVAEAP